MAQTVSELWTQLWNTSNTKREYAFDIEGVWYEQNDDAEVEHNVESSLYSDFGIGNAAESTLSLSLYADDIPRAAQIKRYIRLVNGDQVSEWLPKGVFWANRRPNDDGFWTVEAVDAMHKADVVWELDQSLVFPMPMTEAVEIIAALMGVEIDPRTTLNPAYTIDYPVSKQTLRKTLGWIAAAHGGNFRMTDEGKLLLVPLISAPAETNYLVTETGAPIVIGGMKILVDDAASGLGNADGSKFYVGLDITSFSNNGKYKPVSRVTLLLDDENALTAGDDTGFEIVADCPYATQTMVDDLLAQFRGYEYQAYEAEEANIDPAAELGDGVTVNGIYSVIAKISDDGEGYPSLAAPGKAELEEDLLLGGPIQQEFSRKIAETNSLISKTAEEIRMEVENELEGLSAAIEIDLTEIIGRVEDTESDLSQTLRIGADGVTITNVAGSRLEIDGGQLKAASIEADAFKANSITADKLNITGAITFGDLSSDVQDDINDAYIMAQYAQSDALYASNQVAAMTYVYNGKTYIDESMLMTERVIASNLMGGSVALLAYNQTVVGSMDIAYTTTGIGVGLTSNYGGLKIEASGGNVYAESGYGSFMMLGYDANYGGAVCQLGGGPLIIPGYSYGTSLPSRGTYGQVFFLLE